MPTAKTHIVSLFHTAIPAGFPSPAHDYTEDKLDLNEKLIKHPAATFFIRVSGDSMKNAGIFPDDILIVDRAEEARDGSIVVAYIDGEFTVKRIRKTKDRVQLVSENSKYRPIDVRPDPDFQIWGVVKYVIHETKAQ